MILFDVVILYMKVCVERFFTFIGVYNTGIDALLRRVIKPALPPDAIGVHFMPVRSFEVGGDENLCVVMLTIPSNMNTLYYLSEKQTCFLRLPKGNVQLTLREVRQRAVLLTEKRYLSFSH